MRLPWEDKPQTRNDLAIDEIYNFLESGDPSTKEYAKAVRNLKTLRDIEMHERPEPLNRNTILTVAAYVSVAGAVLLFEIYGHTITTKVLSVALPKPHI